MHKSYNTNKCNRRIVIISNDFLKKAMGDNTAR